jgi:proteasome lid subunit RPN8/RPN11
MLKLPAALAESIRSHAGKAYPEECCGILLGRVAVEDREVRELRACANARAGSGNRYAIDPRDLIAAQREGRERGLEVVGFYHSHPDHPPEPSATDLEEAQWEGCVYLIVSVTRGRAGEMRAYVLRGETPTKRLEPESIAEV